MKKQDSGWPTALCDWRKLPALFLILIGGTGLFLPSAHALTGTIYGDVADGQANSDATVNSTSTQYCRLGADVGVRHSVINVFQIPSAILTDPTQQFSAATYALQMGSGSTMTVNGDLYGLGYSTSPAISPADFYEGALDTTSALLKDNFITPSTPAYANVTESGAALVNHLNDCLAAARASGASTAYVFIRNSLDAYIWSGIYIVAMAETSGGYRPKLTYTTATVPAWGTVPLGGGGYVIGLASDPTGSNIYCRTDVGGAFRWSPIGDVDGNGAWVSISDSMVPFGTTGAWALMSVESIATDPSTPNRVYVAAGNPNVPSGLRGIYGSDNQGASWYLVDSSFLIQGNLGTNASGERLAVDPNNPNIVWYGSITTGLRKFVKSGSTWTASQIPSTSVPFGTVNTGITFVVCDKNSGSTIIYAGVSDATAGGVYRSTDGGTTWSKVGGATVLAPRRAQIASNGTLYVTAGTGGVAKMPRAGSLSLLSSLPVTGTNPTRNLVYHSVAVDPNDVSGNTVYVGEFYTGTYTNIFRSSDGGTTWFSQGTTFNEGALTSTNHGRKEPDGTGSLTGYWFGATSSLLVNPANSNELWSADFFGVNRTRNAQNLGTNPGAWWYTLQKGQEETVVLALKNAPTGAKLMTGLADVAGFRYLDTTVRPSGAGGSRFGNLTAGNDTSLDFSEGNPNVWARAWVNPTQSAGAGAVSTDGGVNWIAFGQVDYKVITNAPTDGWETFDIGPYLQQQQAAGKTAVTLVLRSSSSQVNNYLLAFSSKEGANPPQMVLNGTVALTPTADAVVLNGGATTNYGNNVRLYAQNYFDQTGYVRTSYIKFDLTGQPAITSATLRLYRLATADTYAFPTAIYGTPTTSWIEGDGGTDNLPAGEITWNNKPTDIYAPPGALWKGGGRMAVSATNPNNLVWLGIKNGTNVTPAYYSKDRGVSWTVSTGGPDTQITGIYTNGNSTGPSGQPLAADRGNGNFYIGTFGAAAHVIYRSTNSGATWTQASTVPNGNSYNMRTPQLIAAPVSPACPTGGDVWLCDDGTYNTQGGGLWRSTNSATSWSSIAGIGKVTEVSFGKAASGTGYTVFIHGYKAGVKGVYRSDDYGVTWVQLPNPTINDIISLTGDRQNYGKVFIGTNGRGIFQGQ